MLKSKIFVLARNYEDARNFAYKQGYHYSQMVNVDRREKLAGLRGEKIYVLAEARNRKNYHNLMQEISIRQLIVELVD